MKKKLLKGLIFFIAMMLSISNLNAQCQGNKVRLFKPVGRSSCISRCVSPNQVERYVSNGWFVVCSNSGFGFSETTRKTNTDKILLSNSKQEEVKK